MDQQVTLKVNEQGVRLNAFVQRAIAGTVIGLVASLDELPAAIAKIEITIEKISKESGQKNEIPEKS